MTRRIPIANFVEGQQVRVPSTKRVQRPNEIPAIDISDLYVGQALSGIPLRYTEFGIYVDVGPNEPAYLMKRMMKVTTRQLFHKGWEVIPSGTIFRCYVHEIDLHRNRVRITTYPPEEWDLSLPIKRGITPERSFWEAPKYMQFIGEASMYAGKNMTPPEPPRKPTRKERRLASLRDYYEKQVAAGGKMMQSRGMSDIKEDLDFDSLAAAGVGMGKMQQRGSEDLGEEEEEDFLENDVEEELDEEHRDEGDEADEVEDEEEELSVANYNDEGELVSDEEVLRAIEAINKDRGTERQRKLTYLNGKVASEDENDVDTGGTPRGQGVVDQQHGPRHFRLYSKSSLAGSADPASPAADSMVESYRSDPMVAARMNNEQIFSMLSQGAMWITTKSLKRWDALQQLIERGAISVETLLRIYCQSGARGVLRRLYRHDFDTFMRNLAAALDESDRERAEQGISLEPAESRIKIHLDEEVEEK